MTLGDWEKHGDEKQTQAIKPNRPKRKWKATTGSKQRKPVKKITRKIAEKVTEKKPTKGTTKTTDKFVIDTREPGVMSRHFETFKVKYQLRTMRFGDYRRGYCIAERKTIFDFVGSFRSTRLFTQLEGLTREDCYPFLVVVGTIDKLKEDVHYAHINEKTVIGAMASCICRYGVNVIWVNDDVEAVMVMTQLFGTIADGSYKRPDGIQSDKFLMMPRNTTNLIGEGVWRKEIMEKMAEVICNEKVCIFWANDLTLSLSVMSRMFHKINEGKQGKPRRSRIKHDTGNQISDLVRNFLRVEPALATSLVNSARQEGVGVMRYIMEVPDHILLSHPGVGNVTLKRLRELVG